jgi:hypothetical protein
MRVFIAGVMQGSRCDDKVNEQGYREVITRILQDNLEGVQIVDPWALHPGSEAYDTGQAREVFMSMTALARQVDVLVAYVPEASMGTAVEMWEAHRAGVQILTISSMAENWVVKLLSSRVFPTLETFGAFVASGGLHLLREVCSKGSVTCSSPSSQPISVEEHAAD